MDQKEWILKKGISRSQENVNIQMARKIKSEREKGAEDMDRQQLLPDYFILSETAYWSPDMY